MDVIVLCLEKECYLVEYGYWVDYTKKTFSRNNIVPFDVVHKMKPFKKKIGVFKTVYRYNNKDIDNAYLIGDLYFDFDDSEYENVKEDALRTIELLYHLFGIEKENINIFFSGNKGLHFTVSKDILGIVPHKNLNAIFKEIILTIYNVLPNKTLDTKIYDNKRLFRVANTKHEKTGLYKIPITFKELLNLNSNDIKELAKTNRKIYNTNNNCFNKKANDTYLKYVNIATAKINRSEEIKSRKNNNVITSNPPCILHLYKNGANNGNRNNAAAMLTSFLRNKGYDYSKVYQIVREWNDNISNPLKDFELSRTCKSMFTSSSSYGCTSFKIISECDEENCPLKRKVKRK